jgi:heat shock protein HslJ
MNDAGKFHFSIYLILGLWFLTACTNLSQEKDLTPESESTSPGLGSISGIIRTDQGFCGSIRVFAHEINSGQITDIQTQEGDCAYTIPDLQVGNYLVVGWVYPGGASGAYTSLETVMAVGLEEAQDCEEAIVTIALKPGEDFTGADIGCWGGDFFDIAAPRGQIRLEPNRWKLTELDDQALIVGTGITLIFEDGKFNGSAGCNNYGGTYTTSPGGGLTLNEIEKNAMLCTEPTGIMEQEEHYFSVLISARRYLTLNEELELLNEDGIAVLKFIRMPQFSEVSPEDLLGKTWRLVAAPGLDEVDLGEFTLSFDGHNFSGTTTCRDYAGTYIAANDRLNIGFLEMTTDVACEQILMNAEGGYTTLLENIEQYNVHNNQLELYTLRGEKITFGLVTEKE